jgi:hypothetical protein
MLAKGCSGGIDVWSHQQPNRSIDGSGDILTRIHHHENDRLMVAFHTQATSPDHRRLIVMYFHR